MAEELPPVAEEVVQRRVSEVRLRLVVQQVARMPVVMALIDIYVLIILVQADLALPGLLWLAASTVMQIKRWKLARAELARPSASPEETLQRLSRLFVILGGLRAAVVPLLFYRPIAEEHYLFTMVHVGMAAGGAAAVGGLAKPYLWWTGLVGGALVLGWGSQGTFEGLSVGFLLLLLLGLLVAFVRDQGRSLEERERLAESLRLERDRTQAASESKTRFFAAASHDLRQPLHALSINATTLELLADRQTEPLMRELSLSISRALRQSNGLLDSLLDISLLEANVVKVHLEPVQAVALMQALCEEFEPTARQRGLRLAVDWEASSDDADVWITTDPKQMRRVLGNLISNGLKFTEKGSVLLSLQRLPDSDSDSDADARGSVLISVTDTGSGIAPEEHERVFEDFYQVGNRSRDRSQGLGLGLSIVRRTSALLNLSITMHSAPGIGTRFDLLTPVCGPPANSTDAAPLLGPEGSLSTTVEPNARVLAIDDEPDILDSLTTMLPHFGCEVRCAAGLSEALAILDTGFVPEILLVDHRLKGESGSDVINALRERLGEVPAVVVTGDTAPHDLQNVVMAATTVVHKPIDGRLLARALADALITPVT